MPFFDTLAENLFVGFFFNIFWRAEGGQRFLKEIDYVRNKQSSIPICQCISCVRRGHWLLFKTCAAYERMRQWGEYKYDFKRQFMYFRFYSSGNSTDANCTEVLLSTDYADPDATINCKLTEEIFPKYLDQLQTCKENFPPYGRFVYSCSSMIIQYLLPTITISIGKYVLCHFIQYYSEYWMYVFSFSNVLTFCIQTYLLCKRFLLCSLLPNLRTTKSASRSENAAITNQRDACL